MTTLKHSIAYTALLLSIVGTGISTSSYAQSSISSPSNDVSNGTVAQVRTSEINGDITKVDGGIVTILDGNGKAYEYSLNDSIKITRNTNIAKSSDIKVGDKVKALVDNDKNTLIGLDATNPQIFDVAKYAIPAVILGIVIIGLILYFFNKNNKGKILTATESSNV